jgi:signal transduction histidine kinase/DNA-binding response OmpR family regulator
MDDVTQQSADVVDVLEAAGDVGRDLLAVEWERTPLGPPRTWPPSLAAVVSILVTSRFSMWMAWGPELTFFCNDAYRRDTLGEKYPWALGQPASEVWREIWPDIGPRIERVMRTGVATWDEQLLLFLERSGYREETYHTFSYSPLHDDDSRIAGMLCVVTEDTEQVIGERRMRTLHELSLATAGAGTEDELLEAAARGLDGNRRSLPFTLFHLLEPDGTARLGGTSGIAADHPAARDAAGLWPVARMAAGDGPVVVDLAGHYPDLPAGGWDTPPTQALAVPLRQQGQAAPAGFMIAALNPFRPLDATYRAFVELVAAQVGAGLSSARAYETERDRAESLAELDRAKTAFFTNVSHELRTPLTLLLSPAEDVLADTAEPLPPRHRDRIELVHRNAQRLLKLVNTLLDFSRLESGQATATFEPVDLCTYTAELAAMFESPAQRAGLVLEVDCRAGDAPHVYVDREMWAKIVLNLLSNAVKFTADGTVRVTLRHEHEQVRLAVADTGAGIDPADQPRLFDRFHRVSGAQSRSHEGSGIGLALVAELTALHGGEVTVDSRPGEGATFTVTLPLGSGHLPADQVVDHAPGTPPSVEQTAAGYVAEAMRWLDDAPVAGTAVAPREDRPRILVADDNPDMREYVTSLLAPDYAVEAVPDGAQALERALADPPDLVLTDVMMPELDGFALLAALHAAPATMHVPVMMLSARAGEDGILEGLEAGADDYLIKPFAARELLARVRANLELDRARATRDKLQRSQALLDQAQRLAGLGSWEIELATGRVTGSDEFVRQMALTPEELAAGYDGVLLDRVHPDDLARVQATIAAAIEGGPLDYETRVVLPSGDERVFRTIGELERDEDGVPVRLRGSNQDVTEQRAAEAALAATAAEREAAAREHEIATELQRSLLPAHTFQPDHLDIATFYRSGVAGTQVGGDWYDVIELGTGRAALVIGDVMGRGVRAAAVMGQLRTAVRAYARLDLPPADLLERLDGLVRDENLDQIVTVLCAVYDPADGSFLYANAGHLPPLLVLPGEPARRLTAAAGPPVGSGPFTLGQEQVTLPIGATVALYTDGLVERRDRDLDTGIDALAERLTAMAGGDVATLPDGLVDGMLPDGPDDDVAVLVAYVPDESHQASEILAPIVSEPESIAGARDFVTATLAGWEVGEEVCGRAVLLASELVTNAVLHGRPPVELRLRRTATELVLEVHDGAGYLPSRRRAAPDDENGRGLQLVAALADRWGSRPVADGKSVWCVLALRRR